MYINASTRLKQKLLHYHSSRSIEKDFTIKNLNKQIELCNADLNKATFKNVMFLSFAEGGAMGCPGKIIFYVKTGEGYSLNYVYRDADLNKVKELCPVLQECFFGMFGIRSKVPAGWNYVNLGMGNHLIVNDEVYEAFTEKIDMDTEQSVIYQIWKKVAYEILKEKEYKSIIHLKTPDGR